MIEVGSRKIRILFSVFVLLIFCWLCCWRPYLQDNCGFSHSLEWEISHLQTDFSACSLKWSSELCSSLCCNICSPQRFPLLFIFQKRAVDIHPTRTWTSALRFFFSLLCLCQGSWAKCHSPGICSFLLLISLPDCSAGVRAINPRACLMSLQFLKPVAHRNWSPHDLWMVAECWPLLSPAEAEQGLGQTTKSGQQKKWLWAAATATGGSWCRAVPDSGTGQDSPSSPVLALAVSGIDHH